MACVPFARDLGPRGVHVCWIEVDGVIDVPGRPIPGLGKEDMLDPDAIAETYWQVAHQHPSAWTNEMEVRPFKETVVPGAPSPWGWRAG